MNDEHDDVMDPGTAPPEDAMDTPPAEDIDDAVDGPEVPAADHSDEQPSEEGGQSLDGDEHTFEEVEETFEEVEAPTFVSLHHVSKWYGDVIAVNGIDVHLDEGITGLLGPNGAGKTTVMKMLMGLIRPSHGHVTVFGDDPWDNPQLLKRIGYVPEAPAPWRELSGREAIARAATMSGIEDPDIDDVLARVGLSDAGGKKVATYSHGMQQRLKFALALVHDPDLFILDEPLLGTDPLARRDLIRLLRELAADGKSILLSTHVLSDIEQLTDNILLLNHGRLIAHGDVHGIRDIMDKYPRTIRVGTSEPRRVGAELWNLPGTISIEADDHSVTVRTADASDYFAALQERLTKGDLPFESITSPDDNVEAVFRYLVG